jgi:hypothetical protein
MSVARQLGSLFAGGTVAGLSDRQLIARFVAGRDSPAAEAAFAALVARHGPMVLDVRFVSSQPVLWSRRW